MEIIYNNHFSQSFKYNLFPSILIIPNFNCFGVKLEERHIKNCVKWCIDSINHEELHRIIYEEEGLIASVGLDYLGYNFVTGYIHKEK